MFAGESPRKEHPEGIAISDVLGKAKYIEELLQKHTAFVIAMDWGKDDTDGLAVVLVKIVNDRDPYLVVFNPHGPRSTEYLPDGFVPYDSNAQPYVKIPLSKVKNMRAYLP